jgi:serine/threonine protein kinase
MHENCGISHLDIKAENVVLNNNYIAKLIDFAFYGSATSEETIMRGTDYYMAPEVYSCA